MDILRLKRFLEEEDAKGVCSDENKCLSDAADETRRHSDGSVCRAKTRESCPLEREADSVDDINSEMGMGEDVDCSEIESAFRGAFEKLNDGAVHLEVNKADNGNVNAYIWWDFPEFGEKYTDAWISDFPSAKMSLIAKRFGMHLYGYSFHTNPIDDVGNDGRHIVSVTFKPGKSREEVEMERSEQRERERIASAERYRAAYEKSVRESEARKRDEEDLLKRLGLI